MPAGQWAVLPTRDLAASIGHTGGSSDNVVTFFHQHGFWFSAQREALFVGGDHNGGNERLVRALLEAGADPGLKNPESGMAAAEVARHRGHDDLAALIENWEHDA